MAEISRWGRAGILLLALGCGWPGTAAASPAPRPATGRFLSLSDLHFNPFYDPSLVPRLVRADVGKWRAIFASSRVRAVSTYGRDVNDPLLESALAAARRAARKPDFILISGDFLGHDFEQSFTAKSPDPSPAAYRSFVQKTLRYVTARIRQTFPGVPVYPALGNNDSYCGDYRVEPAGPFLAALHKTWRPLLGPATGTFDQTFPLGGFYSVRHPTVPRQRIVGLNSVFWSRKYQNACGSAGNPAALELGWLAYTLQQAALAGETVWIVGHIPPGIDVYSTVHATGPCESRPVPLWQADALASYQQITAAAPGTVAAFFAGHTHIDDFRLPADGSLVHGTPAISPIYDNNPGFQLFTYDRASGALKDFRTFYLDVSKAGTSWALEYDFQQAYGQSAYNPATLKAVQQAIVDDPDVRSRFLSYYPVESEKGKLDPQDWKSYACGIVSLTPAAFASCACPASP